MVDPQRKTKYYQLCLLLENIINKIYLVFFNQTTDQWLNFVFL